LFHITVFASHYSMPNTTCRLLMQLTVPQGAAVHVFITYACIHRNVPMPTQVHAHPSTQANIHTRAKTHAHTRKRFQTGYRFYGPAELCQPQLYAQCLYRGGGEWSHSCICVTPYQGRAGNHDQLHRRGRGERRQAELQAAAGKHHHWSLCLPAYGGTLQVLGRKHTGWRYYNASSVDAVQNLQTHVLPEGVIWRQKWYGFGMLLGYGSRSLHTSSSALICRFQCSWVWNVQSTGAIPNRPRRDPYILSSHMLYLTSQRTKLCDF